MHKGPTYHTCKLKPDVLCENVPSVYIWTVFEANMGSLSGKYGQQCVNTDSFWINTGGLQCLSCSSVITDNDQS